MIEETLLECPQCHQALGEAVEVKEQIQEDIIPAHVRVRKYRRHVYCCEHCEQKVTAPYHPEHVPFGLSSTVRRRFENGLDGDEGCGAENVVPRL